MAIEARLRARLGADVASIWSDDGIAIRLPDGDLDGVEDDLFPDAMGGGPGRRGRGRDRALRRALPRERGAGPPPAAAPVLPGGRLPAGMLLGHERVAEVDVKIGRIGQGVGQRLPVDRRVGLLIQCESAVIVKVNLLPGGRGVWKVYSALPANESSAAARAEFVVVASIRLQRIDQDLDRLSRFERLRRRGLGMLAPLRSVSDISLDILVRAHAQRDRVVRRPGEDHIERMLRHLGAKLAAVAFQPLSARLGRGPCHTSFSASPATKPARALARPDGQPQASSSVEQLPTRRRTRFPRVRPRSQ